MGNDSTIKISVIICTFNRSHYLREALKSLLRQTCDSELYEVVVVDNRSTDSTREAVEELAGGSKADIRYVFEDRQGLSYARNAGIDAAMGEIVTFMDDDAVADPRFVENVIAAFQGNESMLVLGGRVRPIWEVEKPEWMFPRLLKNVTVIDLGSELRIIDYPREWFAGANMSFRKEVFDHYGRFNIELGRKGKSLMSHEEIELLDRMKGSQVDFYYSPSVVVDHHVPKGRLKKGWFVKRFFYQGRSECIYEYGRDGTVNLRNRMRRVTKALPKFVAGVLFDIRMNRQKTFESFLVMLLNIGFMMEAVKIMSCNSIKVGSGRNTAKCL